MATNAVAELVLILAAVSLVLYPVRVLQLYRFVNSNALLSVEPISSCRSACDFVGCIFRTCRDWYNPETVKQHKVHP